MATGIFLGSLMVLILVAVIVVTMTSSGRESYPAERDFGNRQKSLADPTRMDR